MLTTRCQLYDLTPHHSVNSWKILPTWTGVFLDPVQVGGITTKVLDSDCRTLLENGNIHFRVGQFRSNYLYLRVHIDVGINSNNISNNTSNRHWLWTSRINWTNSVSHITVPDRKEQRSDFPKKQNMYNLIMQEHVKCKLWLNLYDKSKYYFGIKLYTNRYVFRGKKGWILPIKL